ncbi:butyrophilin subfamily 1 member A1-like [Hemiscyllium ocellatum]|uniref:butyrophilin subfamily 1 member A1-like n=1 Tax=Hemiscyllium ocellatum TaxID=170820 RepID=UPI0029674DE6|nr:butyrophilin subfamily 1 member A1-like [Hemiscyllium ocellatum]XP_060706871.1 butyrophilin subfamily 1 member A1-like [Hemiscyllium ocellatum]
MFLLLWILVWIFHVVTAEAVTDFAVTGPPNPIIGVVKGNVVLHCQLVPAKAPQNMEVRWINIVNGYNSPVHMYKEGADDLTFQPLAYRGRTELFLNEVAQGNLSLRLKDVQVSDRGLYKCFVASDEKHHEVKLTLNVAGTGRQPRIEMEGQMGDGIRLGCRSEGWYPHPSILWVDGDGVNMTAQQQITYQPDPQGLFTVSSSIAIPKQSPNKYRCVINNVILKETQEAHIQIADSFFPNVSGWLIAFWILFALIVAAVALAVWYHRKLQNKIQGLKKSDGFLEHQRLLDIMEQEKRKVHEEHQRLHQEIENAKQARKKECEELQQLHEKKMATIIAEHEQFKKQVDEERETEKAEYQKLRTEFEQWRPLVQSEWNRIRSYAAHVKMDPETANACLTVSPDRLSVQAGDAQDVPDNPERFDSVPYVLGMDGFAEGSHYWEVKVADKSYWDVGVTKGSVQRKGMPDLCADAGFWTIGKDGEPYGISDAQRSKVTVTTSPGTIGVFLEMEAGRVSFYNADDMFHLYTFQVNFSEKVYPFFWPGWDKSPLTVCPVKN